MCVRSLGEIVGWRGLRDPSDRGPLLPQHEFFSANADYTAGDGGGPRYWNSVRIAAFLIEPPERARTQ